MEQRQACIFCGQGKALRTLRYGKRNDSVPPEHIAYKTMEKQFANVEDFHICPDCIQARGKAPRKAWAWYWGLTLIFYACLFATVAPAFRQSAGSLAALARIPFVLAFFVRIGFGMYLASNAGLGYGALILALIGQFAPLWGDLTLLLLRKRINGLVLAKSALKPSITAHFDALRAQREALRQQVDSGEITDQATIQAVRRQEAREAEQLQQQQTAVAKGNIWHSLAGFAITIAILLQGLSAYSGRGYMQLFNSIRLSAGQFYLLIAALLVFDVSSLVNALNKRKG